LDAVFALPSPFPIEQSHRADFVDSLQKFRPPGAVKTGRALHPAGSCDLQLSLLFFKTTLS
jgi:hypothetical protein